MGQNMVQADASGAPSRAIPQSISRSLLKVPPLSHAAVKLHSLKVEEANMRTISTLISSDPPLSTLVLRLVNSPLFGVRYRVTGILQAVALLGVDRLRVLATTAAFRMLMSTALDLPTLGRCWRHSVACALATQELSKDSSVDRDTAYTAGLLHDIGRFAMLSCWPKQYSDLLNNSHPSVLSELEFDKLGVSHTTAGAFLLRHWGLPEHLVEVAQEHHSSALDERPRLVELVACGCHLADAIGFAVTVTPPDDRELENMLSSLVPDPDDFRFRIADGINQIECL